jgi:hypothetical protein
MVLFGKKDYQEFHAKYLGGHPAYPKEQDVHLRIYEDRLTVIGGHIKIDIPWAAVTDIENTTQEKLSAARILLVGVLAWAWKKKDILTLLTCKSAAGDLSLVFKIDGVEKAQPLLYSKMIAAKS